MNKKQIKILTFVSLILVAFLSVQSTLSYFYTYVTADGAFTVLLNDKSEIDEKIPEAGIKNLIIKSTEKDPIFVRVKYFAPKKESVKLADGQPKWSAPDSEGYFYYSDKLDGGQEVEVKFDVAPPTDAKAGEEYNVILIYEATPALYSETNGWYADWNRVIQPGTAIVEEGN